MTALCCETQNVGRPIGPVAWPEPSIESESPLARFPPGLRPFLSVVAWQHISRGHLDVSTQPFDATIFFGDMVNSSTLLTQYPLLTVPRLLNRFLTLLQRIIHEHGGFTEKLLGDGLLGVFHGAPAALRAAQAAHDALDDFNAERTARGERPLLARIALDSGSIIIASLGGPWRMDHTVVGVPVHAASHLLQFARPGEIWFTQATRDRLAGIDLLTETSLVELKGYVAPQMVYYLGCGSDRMLQEGSVMTRC
jgi:class 3 adenylate cyclase